MRSISSGNRAEIRAAVKRPVFFFEAHFKSGPVFFWTGSAPLVWQGQTWSAPTGSRSGSVLMMESLVESAAIQANGLKFTLSGVDPVLLADCLDELSISGAFKMWLGFVNDSGALVDDPAPCFEGFLDSSHFKFTDGAWQIVVTVEGDLRRLQIPIERRLTLEDQQVDFPNDTIFRFMPAAVEWNGMWGQLQVAAPNARQISQRKMSPEEE